MTFELKPPLKALAYYNQFVLWRIEDNGGKKPAKIPFNALTGFRHDPHDPAIWMDLNKAISLSTLLKCGVAFVITENDPFFCIDLDEQRNIDGTWTQWSQDMIKYFDGAAVEISYSGNGYHIFGKYSETINNHRVKVKEIPGLEVYTRKRFIALGDPIGGDASTDHTQALKGCIASVGGTKDDVVPLSWTTGPVEQWVGPEDDVELIKIMTLTRSSVGAAQAFDGVPNVQKATLNDLWIMNTEALALTYPSGTGKPFDHSSADMALMMHLAFWTGKDCARMDRLYRMSALMRPKWDRDGFKTNGYLVTTTTEACRKQQKVFVQKKPKINVNGVNAASPDIAVKFRDGYQLLLPDQQEQHFAGCIYIQDVHRVLNPSGDLLTAERFKAWYGGYEFVISSDGKTIKDAWETFTQSRIVSFPKANGLTFRPESPPGQIFNEEGRILVNTYVPAIVDMKQGDVTPFLNHMYKIIPDHRDLTILLSYCAACVQYPGVKFQWCPVLQGVEGNGKSLLARCLTKAVGERYTATPNASEIDSKFNGWIAKKLLVICDEIHFKGNQEIQDALKRMVTDDRIEIQPKNQDQYTGDNRANWFMTTNFKDAVIKTRDGRRYAIFFTEQQSKADIIRDGMGSRTSYFPDLYNWLKFEGGYSYVSYFLNTFDIPDEYNPATSCHTAPSTTSDEKAIIESMGPIEQLIFEAIAQKAAGFRFDYISLTMVKAMLKMENIRCANNKIASIIESMGYIKHPGLSNGRSNCIIPEEGFSVRPIIFVKQYTEASEVKEDVIDIYRYAQNYAPLEETGHK